MADFFDIYDALIDSVGENSFVDKVYYGRHWASASVGGSCGLAMACEGDSIRPKQSFGNLPVSLKEAAAGIKSWNYPEASISLAACNAFFNTSERLQELDCYEPYENYCTAGLKLSGAKIGLIGHLTVTPEMKEKAKEIFIIERAPKPGDYPDPACEFILPSCDIVLITGSALINKTLPRLLELSRNAYTILTGPSVPMCPELLNFGIDRLAGMVVSDPDALNIQLEKGLLGSPYPYGTSFMLKK